MTDPGAEKEEGLEEGMSHKMEDCSGPRTHSEGKEHVADLTHGRIGENTLYVFLGRALAPAIRSVKAPIIATTTGQQGQE